IKSNNSTLRECRLSILIFLSPATQKIWQLQLRELKFTIYWQLQLKLATVASPLRMLLLHICLKDTNSNSLYQI
ncbi:hypothetical protein PJI17_31860, partial [Mycobacterium kansasii]